MRSGTRGQRSQLIKKILGTFEMFDDIKGQDIVELLTRHLQQTFIEISKEEVIKFPRQSPALHVATGNRAVLNVL